MAATLTQFRLQVPELASVGDSTVALWLGLTLPRINAELFGGRASEAQIWLAAHELTTSPTGASAVPVVAGASSVSVGPVSVSYATGAAAAQSRVSSIYLQRYEALARAASLGAAALLMPVGEVL